MDIKLNHLLANFLFIVCLFPYVSLINTPFDTQPYALMVSILIVILYVTFNKDLKVPKLLIPFLIVLAYAFVLVLFSSDIMNAFRSLVGYISVFFLALAGYLTFKYINVKWFIFTAVIWLFIGIVQTVISKNFGSFLLSRLSTTELRGVTSLAVEPSMYAVMCIFFLILNDIFHTRKDYSKKMYNFIFVISIFQIIFLSKATLGFMMLVFYLVSKVFSKNNSVKKTINFLLLIIAFFGFLFVIKFIPSLQQSRLGQLLDQFFQDPLSLVFTDASIADRLSHVLVSHVSLIDSYGLGFGLGTWEEHAPSIAISSGDFIMRLTDVWFTLGRIMSGWGTVVFELGVFGLIFIFTFSYIMLRGAKVVEPTMKTVYKSSFYSILFIMLMAVPISSPMFGYLIGVFVSIQLKFKVMNENTKITTRAS